MKPAPTPHAGPKQQVPNIFISYASADFPVADALLAALEQGGFACWMAPRNITPGADYGEQILQGIRDASIVVLVFSGHSNKSKFCQREVERAVHYGRRIFPIRIDSSMPCGPMEFHLSVVQWMEAQGENDWAEVVEQLAKDFESTPTPARTGAMSTFRGINPYVKCIIAAAVVVMIGIVTCVWIKDDQHPVQLKTQKAKGINQTSSLEIVTPIWEFVAGSGVSSDPAIGSDGTVYVGAEDKKLYALNGQTGVKIWEFETGASVESSPAISTDGTVYVGSGDNKLYAVNSKNGIKYWGFVK